MLTSLNVVRIAAVDCDCTRRSATRWRSRDIGTRCSGRAPSVAGDASRTAAARRRFAAGAAASAAGGLRRHAPRPRRCTSPLVIAAAAAGARRRRPRSRPARPSSCAPRAARSGGGAAGAAARRRRRLQRRRRRLPARLRRRRLRRRRAAAPSPRCRSPRSPRSTSPSSRRPSRSRPARRRRGAGSSSTTLSVSTSIRFSSRADRLAGLLVPADERRLGDRLRQLRDLDFDAHDVPSSLTVRRQCATTISPDVELRRRTHPRSAASARRCASPRSRPPATPKSGGRRTRAPASAAMSARR